MIGLGMIWAMLGPRSIALIVMAVLALYGRSGVLQTRQARAILPWLTPARRAPGTATAPPSRPAARFGLGGDRMFWFFTILAAAALAAWIVTRTIIVSGSGVSH
ncbi:hypothetical protein [Singulisphaera acidiphila]|uniref:Uncharacterized protein n=2 Tax=Singulisphaera acidiphila TaxID=466153 RepID=L0D8F9_SINAD|nr:hypothetical protein [Singulisphaera acidiphila]AGA25155.1 hypothetical protein Sinac_0745 [Singulisphaera acidiphila DSM 18658]